MISYGMVMILLLSLTPYVSADGQQEEPAYAFLPSWNGTISGNLDPSGENYEDDFSNHDYDQYGNLYYLQTEDYGTWMGDQYINGAGYHIMKINIDGQVEYIERLACYRYCTSADNPYNKVISIEVVEEDQFYILISTYRNMVSIGGTYYGSTGYSNTLITAFYSNGTWSWVEDATTSTYSYSDIVHIETDSQSNLFVVQFEQNSGSWRDFSITSYSPNGTNWIRTLSLPNTEYSNAIFDVEGTNIHALITASNQYKYDSQSVQCNNLGEENYCYSWMTVNQNGVRTSSVSTPYASIDFKEMEIFNNSLYLSGNTYDPVVGSNTESNFTGQKISHSPKYGQYVAIMNNNGTWDLHINVNKVSTSYRNYYQISDVLDDGSMVFNALYDGTMFIDGRQITSSTNTDFDFVNLRIKPDHGVLWSSPIGINNPSTFDYKPKGDGSTIAFIMSKTSTTELFYNYSIDSNYNQSNLVNGNYIFWVDADDGKIVDIEPTAGIDVYSRSPEGGVLTSNYGSMYYYMPDFDGDNVGTGDNCPETYNPTQSDYNNNGFGDACDVDDDSDGVEDVSDLCP